MKKNISLILVLIIIIGSVLSTAGAYSYEEDLDVLRSQFSRATGPKAGNLSIDYSYFTPEIKDENTKYPLVVLFPGRGESFKKGNELTHNSFCLWTSDEIQARFTNGGAYLMILRSNADLGYEWNGKAQLPAAKAAINDFISKNPNVDTTRLYTVGWSYGASASMNFAVEYPNMVAGVLSIAPVVSFSQTDTDRLVNTAVWIFHAKADTIGLESYGQTTWANLKSSANDLTKIRYTIADRAPNAGALISHAMWDLALYDTDKLVQNFDNVRTIEGKGGSFRFDDEHKIISWLTSQVLDSTDSTLDCTHACHKSGFSSFIWKLQLFFYRLFGVSSKRICDCGVVHW